MRTRPFSPRRPPAQATGRPAERLLATRPPAALCTIERVLRKLPPLAGAPIGVRFRGSLWVRKGRLADPPAGVEVHAAAFIRRRKIILEGALLGHPVELARILIHELFHFVWVRLGNAGRRSWELLIRSEVRRGAPGELGYSAQWRKDALRPRDWQARSRRWREYLCESFCDSAAWFFSRKAHEEFTLADVWRRRRRRWLERLMARATLPV